MSETVGFGIIGCGLVSQFHGRSITDLEDARVVAATDFDPSRAAKFVDEFGGEVVGSSEELCARSDVDIVTVLTPNAHHAEHVIRAAEHGKHVLVEKPPEMTLEATDLMIEACRNADVRLGVCLQVRMREAIQKAMAIAEEK